MMFYNFSRNILRDRLIIELANCVIYYIRMIHEGMNTVKASVECVVGEAGGYNGRNTDEE